MKNIQYIERAEGTNRTCAVCTSSAIRFGYTQSKASKKPNPSSRTPLCLAHAVTGPVAV